jgi:predicted ArsR family transcriptional regulator
MAQAKRSAAGAADRSRRELLKGLAALAAAGCLPEALAQASGGAGLPAAQFASLSTAITGYAYADRRAADAMLRALAQAVGDARLARLARLAAATPAAQLGDALAAANLQSAAETVVAALYTGVVETPQGPRVVSYDQALVWQACGWTKPNAFCGGSTNYWSAPPQPQSS